MFVKLYISLLFGLVSSQLNGEFWWLNEKVAQLYNIEPPQPMFDDVSEFDTDESVKIIFRDADVSIDANEDIEKPPNISNNSTENMTLNIYFQDQSSLAKPISLTINDNLSDKLTNKDLNKSNDEVVPTPISDFSSTPAAPLNKDHSEDVLNFVFPDDNALEWDDKTEFDSTQNNGLTTNKPDTTTTSFKNDNKLMDSESICTFITTVVCLKRRGNPYSFNGRPLSQQKVSDDQIICCILPIKAYDASRILFPNMQIKKYKRFKRSNTDTENTALKQRNALMRRKYQSQEVNPRLSTTTSRTILTQRIVTPEDYLDPYWNIKNSKFRNPAKDSSDQSSDSKFDYGHKEYADDYTVEIPKPGGLVGLYSDHGWSVAKPNTGYSYGDSGDTSEESGDGDFSIGYSTIDPRLGTPLLLSATRRKPAKLSISSIGNTHNSASQLISFRSKPDFQVMQGFKLLNLAKNKNRFVRKTTAATSTVNDYQDSTAMSDRPSKAFTSYGVDYEDFIDAENQVYSDCGKIYNNIYDIGRESGELDKGTSPWLTLVVLTRSRQSILCYATLIHPQAAVTAADCVYGTAPGEVSIITGAFDLSEENAKTEHRLTTVITHPQYKPGQLSGNLAVLHWKRPLTLGRNVQPACMSDPHVGDDCYFVGWGGYDEGIRQRPHWQRAFILSPKICNIRLAKLDVQLPTDAFCASVDSTRTVTGVGGPLICMNNGRQSIVGVAVWRDNVILTLPVLEWTARIVEDIVN
ncbi:unnamed protein product [Colias eurytheme]|nr:unnamed protein product [Colias eurytheme]